MMFVTFTLVRVRGVFHFGKLSADKCRQLVSQKCHAAYQVDGHVPVQTLLYTCQDCPDYVYTTQQKSVCSNGCTTDCKNLMGELNVDPITGKCSVTSHACVGDGSKVQHDSAAVACVSHMEFKLSSNLLTCCLWLPSPVHLLQLLHHNRFFFNIQIMYV